jgi:hypothetical protein
MLNSSNSASEASASSRCVAYRNAKQKRSVPQRSNSPFFMRAKKQRQKRLIIVIEKAEGFWFIEAMLFVLSHHRICTPNNDLCALYKA